MFSPNKAGADVPEQRTIAEIGRKIVNVGTEYVVEDAALEIRKRVRPKGATSGHTPGASRAVYAECISGFRRSMPPARARAGTDSAEAARRR